MYILISSDKPSAPTQLEVLDVSAEAMTLRWKPSTYDGGAPMKQYVIEKKDASKTNWVGAGRVDAGELRMGDDVIDQLSFKNSLYNTLFSEVCMARLRAHAAPCKCALRTLTAAIT